MFLLDTNILLEILLGQEKSEQCRSFITDHANRLYLSDFSLHSIGVILFRLKKPDLFQEFISEVLPRVTVVQLPSEGYGEIRDIHGATRLDFDDSFQLAIARTYDLTLVTLDNDFANNDAIERISVNVTIL